MSERMPLNEEIDHFKFEWSNCTNSDPKVFDSFIDKLKHVTFVEGYSMGYTDGIHYGGTARGN